ncbi:MAG: hypothetical protein HYZ42_00070 [Bacteroidetes bacterium]|nr:hypothetical protein [Bacteroidota bacterium]
MDIAAISTFSHFLIIPSPNQPIIKSFWEEDRKRDTLFHKAIINKCFSDFPINITFFCQAASSLIGNDFETYIEFE